MVNVQQVKSGVARFLDSELLSKVNGWQKWIAGAAVNMMMDKSTDIFNELKANSLVKSMGIITQDDMIDIDTVYKYISEQSQKSAVTFTAPVVGAITLRSDDIDKLYNYITGA